MTSAPAPVSLFAGRDVAVGLSPGAAGPLLVTFTPMHAPRPFAEATLAAIGPTVASVVALRPHWWQTDEMPAAIAAIRASEAFRRAERILLFGSSMGGAGALLHSRALDAAAVLALCPQFSVDPKKVPDETRWAEERERLAFTNDDMEAGLSRTARVVIVADPWVEADRRHAARYAALRPVEAVPAPFCGHFLPRYLLDTGALEPILRLFLAGDLTGPRLRGAMRRGRRLSIEYFCNLAAANAGRRRALAADLLRRAGALVATGTPPIGGRRGPEAEAKVAALAARVVGG